MNRFQKGLRLLKASGEVIKQRPALVGVLAAGTVVSLVLGGAAFGVLAASSPAGSITFRLGILIAIQIAVIPTTFTNFVVATIADRHFRGEEITTGEAISFAMTKLPRILQWSMLSAVVGFVLSYILERFKLGGWIASRLLGLAWALATTFVIPILVMEDVRVFDAVSESAKTFKAYWGESVSADAGLGLISLAVLVPFVILGTVLAAAGAMWVGIGLMVVGFFVLMSLTATVSAVKNVALYRLATDGAVVGSFTLEDLKASFKPKKKRFGRS